MTTGVQELIKESIADLAEAAPEIASDAMGEFFARNDLMKDDEINEKIDPFEQIEKLQSKKGDSIKIVSSEVLRVEIEKIKKFRAKQRTYILHKMEKIEEMLIEQKRLIEEKSTKLTKDTNLLNRELRKFHNMKESVNNVADQLSQSHLKEAKKLIDNIKISPLQEILDRTGYCTILETEPGYLYRIFSDDVSLNDQMLLNAPVVARIRYLIREVSPLFIDRTRTEICTEIENLIKSAYVEVAPKLMIKDFFRVRSNKSPDKEGSFSFSILLNISPDINFVMMEVSIDVESKKIWLGETEIL